MPRQPPASTPSSSPTSPTSATSRGFTGSSAALILTNGAHRRAVLFTDGRYTAQARAEAAGTRVVIAPRPMQAACEWLLKSRVKRCGFDAAQTTVASLSAMRKAIAEAAKASNARSSKPKLVAVSPSSPASARSRTPKRFSACAPPPPWAACSSTACWPSCSPA
jgi:Xaa-Pro aminopeptidase